VLGAQELPPSKKADENKPRFEVVSIRQCDGTEPRGAVLTASGDRLSVPCFGLFRLIQDAYQIYVDGTTNFMNQPLSYATAIEGFPDQMSSYRYSIEAKAESPQSMAMMRGPMMQSVLEDRFHVKIHREMKEVPVYIMTAAGGGPKLQASTKDSCDPSNASEVTQPLPVRPGEKPRCGVPTPPKKTGTHFVVEESGINLSVFAQIFKIQGLPVIDRTGLTGTFDIRLEWETSPPNTDQPEGAVGGSPDTSIIGSFRKQLGLNLKPGKGPREFLIIDHVERPTDN
jgi:uncharacterized protein (TIGR03435 family)